MSVSWLLDDLDSYDPQVRVQATRELARRIGDKSWSEDKVGRVVNWVLDRQADRSKLWDASYSDIIEVAERKGRLDAKRWERYLRQGVIAKLEIKPKLRRNQRFTVNLDLKFDRLNLHDPFGWRFTTSPLMVGDVQLMDKGWAASSDEAQSEAGTNITIGRNVADWKAGSLVDGTHEVHATVSIKFGAVLTATRVASSDKAESSPTVPTEPLREITIPLSVPVKLLPADAQVDGFEVDQSLRGKMTEGFYFARVDHDDHGRLVARLKTKSLPMAVAAKVVLSQGGSEQDVGTVLFDAGANELWTEVLTREKPRFTGSVNIRLRPDQSAADDLRTLGTYWGEEIIVPNVVFDAPYTPQFIHDESFRPAVERSLRPPEITRRGKGARALTVDVGADDSPVKLAYSVFLSLREKEVKVDDWLTGAHQHDGKTSDCRDIDLAGEATKCDVIFRPDQNWETHCRDLSPPWAGKVVFHDVNIQPSPSR